MPRYNHKLFACEEILQNDKRRKVKQYNFLIPR